MDRDDKNEQEMNKTVNSDYWVLEITWKTHEIYNTSIMSTLLSCCTFEIIIKIQHIMVCVNTSAYTSEINTEIQRKMKQQVD